MPTFTATFWGEGSPTKIECRKNGTLIPTTLLEDLEGEDHPSCPSYNPSSLARTFNAPQELLIQVPTYITYPKSSGATSVIQGTYPKYTYIYIYMYSFIRPTLGVCKSLRAWFEFRLVVLSHPQNPRNQALDVRSAS